MTDSDWLTRRTPAPPENLAKAIRAALQAANVPTANPTPTELLETAQSLLQRVLETECSGREAALDLLTADALVTYALELASEAPDTSGDFAVRAMKQLAGLDLGARRESGVRQRGSK